MGTRKRASTEAHQAYTTRNQMKFNIFFYHPQPYGIAGVPRVLFIDFDECGFELQSANRTHGCAIAGIRVRKPGNYTKDTKVTVIMGVEPGDPRIANPLPGSIENPRRWLKVNMTPGTTAYQFNDFLEEVMDDLENNHPAGIPIEGRVFLWDNLSSHLTPL